MPIGYRCDFLKLRKGFRECRSSYSDEGKDLIGTEIPGQRKKETDSPDYIITVLKYIILN
jgi:hypothetical protein